jgi:hypothetical protein
MIIKTKNKNESVITKKSYSVMLDNISYFEEESEIAYNAIVKQYMEVWSSLKNYGNIDYQYRGDNYTFSLDKLIYNSMKNDLEMEWTLVTDGRRMGAPVLSKLLSEFFVVCNVCAPGIVASANGDIKQIVDSKEEEKSGVIYVDFSRINLYLVEEVGHWNVVKWPSLGDVDVKQALDWYLRIQKSKKKIYSILKMVVESLKEFHEYRILQLTACIEVLYTKGPEGIQNQLRNNLPLLLDGKKKLSKNQKKALSDMYGDRSKLAHTGDVNYDLKSLSFSLRLILATMKRMIENNALDVSFITEVTYDQGIE